MAEETIDDVAESLLWFLESNPSPMEEVFKHFDQETARNLCRSRMIHFQGKDCHFFITHHGIAFLRSRGRGRKKLAELSWKHNPHEMTAERAIELFAPSSSSPTVTAEGVLVNEIPRKAKPIKKPHYLSPAPFTVKKSKHLPKKPRNKS